MWKKDRNILLFTAGLLALVLLYSAGCLRVGKAPVRAVSAAVSQAVTEAAKRCGIRVVTAGKGKVALTFDDGPHPVYTAQLLDGLAERGVKASFFLTGKNAEQYPELVLRMYREGHLIGNHTYSHLQLNRKNGETFREELVRTNEIIMEITGEEVVYVRPPYGSWDKKLETELNMFPVLWTIDPLDWSSKDAGGVTKRVLAKVKENAIILMHDEYPSTITAALQIVDRLQEEGYELVTVEEILFD